MKKKIEAKIIADSTNEFGDRITSFILTYPRFIHSELMTHRMFSRNSASSRAIPFEKMMKSVEEDPFVPIAWQKDHKGMQGTEYHVDPEHIDYLKFTWLLSSECMTSMALALNKVGQLTKQLCSRLLEPFLWHTVLITATEYQNFFDLRCPKYHTPVSGEGFTFKSKKECLANHSNPENLEKLQNFTLIDWLKINESQAEIHMQALAEAMYDAYNESTPKLLESGQWHVPFGDQINSELLHLFVMDGDFQTEQEHEDLYNLNRLKISVARCARLSYMTFEGEIDYLKDILLHNQLFKNKHLSCFEHVARCMNYSEYGRFLKGNLTYNADADLVYDSSIEGWCNNFKGFVPYRYLIENNGKI